MKLSKLYGLLLIFLTGVIFQRCDTSHNIASPVKNYFLKYFGGEGNQTGVDLVVNADGTFFLLGTTKKPDQLTTQMYLVKADAFGNVIKEITFAGSQGTEAKDIEPTSSGGVVVAGNYLTSPNNHDIFLATFDANGTKLDSTICGLKLVSTLGGGVADEDVNSVTQLFDGGFIVTGSSDHVDISVSVDSVNDVKDAIHVRFNSSLDTLGSIWRNAHGGPPMTIGTKVVQYGNNRFCFFGYSNLSRFGDPSRNFNFLVLDLNSFGEGIVVGQPGKSGTDERLGSVCQATSSSGAVFYLGGISTSNLSSEIYVSRIDETINSVDTTLTYSPGFFDNSIGSDLKTPGSFQTSSAISASSGWFLLTNEATVGNSNLYLTKLNDANTPDWNSPVIYGGALNDFSGAVTELPDGKLLIVGTMAIGSAPGETKMVLMKVNKNGQLSD